VEKNEKRPVTEIPVAEIEGIGEAYAEKLANVGIYHIGDLVFIDPEIEYTRLDSEIPLPNLGKWKAMAAFMQIPGINNQFAEALVRNDIFTLEDLFEASPEKIVKKIDDAFDKKIIPEKADLLTVVEWQKEAIKLSYTSGINGLVSDQETKKPMEGATVSCFGRTTKTNKQGEFILNLVPYGEQSILIEKEGYYDFKMAVNVGARPLKIKTSLKKSVDGFSSPTHASEYESQHVNIAPEDTLVMKQKNLDEIPDGTHLRILKFYKRKPLAKLFSLSKSKVGQKVFIDIIKIERDVVPEGAEEQSIVKKEKGKLVKTDITFKDYVEQRFEKETGMSFDVFKQSFTLVPGGD
jgi:hypothetical protein